MSNFGLKAIAVILEREVEGGRQGESYFYLDWGQLIFGEARLAVVTAHPLRSPKGKAQK